MKHIASAGLLLVAIVNSVLAVQSRQVAPPRVAHSVVILDCDGTILRDVTLVVTRAGKPDSVQCYPTNECGLVAIPTRLDPGEYRFEVQRQGHMVGAGKLTLEPAFAVGFLLAIRLGSDGRTTIEYTGAWVDAEALPAHLLTTVPSP